MQDIDFDLAGARKAGAKPAQLSSYFKSNFNLDFDFQQNSIQRFAALRWLEIRNLSIFGLTKT